MFSEHKWKDQSLFETDSFELSNKSRAFHKAPNENVVAKFVASFVKPNEKVFQLMQWSEFFSFVDAAHVTPIHAK